MNPKPVTILVAFKAGDKIMDLFDIFNKTLDTFKPSYFLKEGK